MFWAETIIAYKNLQGQNCTLGSVVSYECLTMILANVLVLRIFASMLHWCLYKINHALQRDSGVAN